MISQPIRFFLALLLGCCSTGCTRPPAVEGIWELDVQRTMESHGQDVGESPESRILAFCDGTSTFRITLHSQITVAMQFEYKLVGGSSTVAILNLSRSGSADRPMTVRFLKSGIAIEGPDCRSSPEVCREAGVIFVRELYKSIPGSDLDAMIQSVKETDYTDQAPTTSYYVRSSQSCEDFNAAA